MKSLMFCQKSTLLNIKLLLFLQVEWYAHFYFYFSLLSNACKCILYERVFVYVTYLVYGIYHPVLHFASTHNMIA